MNMISELRQRVRQNGKAEITAEEFDKLQAEWIIRSGAADMVEAERERCAKVCDNVAVGPADCSAEDCAAAIRALGDE